MTNSLTCLFPGKSKSNQTAPAADAALGSMASTAETSSTMAQPDEIVRQEENPDYERKIRSAISKAKRAQDLSAKHAEDSEQDTVVKSAAILRAAGIDAKQFN